MNLIKGVSSDHELIELAERIGVHIDDIYESNEIKTALPKKGSFLILLRPPNLDIGHWTAIHNGFYFDSMGEGPPSKYGIKKYNEIQTQSAHGEYCGIWSMLWLYCQQHGKQSIFKRFHNLNAIIL